MHLDDDTQKALDLTSQLCRAPRISAEGAASRPDSGSRREPSDRRRVHHPEARGAGRGPCDLRRTGRAGSIHHPALQPLRRAARRAVRPLGLPAVGAYASRRQALRTRHVRRQRRDRRAPCRHSRRRQARGTLPFTVRWIIEGEEEIGSPHFEQIARSHPSLCRRTPASGKDGRIRDGRPVGTLGYKGLLAVGSASCVEHDAHSGHAAVLPSAAWRLVEALAPSRRDGRVHVPGFYDDVRARRRGRPGRHRRAGRRDHTSPEGRIRPGGIPRRVEGDEARERISFRPTCNIAGISSGYVGPGFKTVLPREATALIDFRLVRDQDPDRVFVALEAHLEAGGFEDIELSKLTAAHPVATELDDELATRVTEIAERSYGAKAKIMPSSPATQPVLAALRRHVGVTGLAAPDNPPHQASAIHAPNEHIRLEELQNAVQFFRAVLTDLHLPTIRRVGAR